ncbi:hypothetical protein PoB_007679800 [Plakobranchus ocellatus]|uniref:Rhodanese domain-containing protein n=1 Tax=Plakobranchus ocellatus TaxID=259542 RepID=A0AAV4E112_9GAST|nr:hypothetical protein PoB_007679800 [Plakobranchus ocellatus]
MNFLSDRKHVSATAFTGHKANPLITPQTSWKKLMEHKDDNLLLIDSRPYYMHRLVRPQPIWLGIAHPARIDEPPLVVISIGRIHTGHSIVSNYTFLETFWFL